jgi:putative hydrolases of HD superfamily
MINFERLSKQLDFIAELDKVKQIFRNTILLDASRMENDAEHSWHMAVSAIVLCEYIDDPNINLGKVLKMISLHDVVEIDAGDTFAYGNADRAEQAKKERKAAERIFGVLPKDQSKIFFELWNEYENGESNEAKYAQALDSFMPIFHNYKTNGLQWKKYKITNKQVLMRNKRIESASVTLWQYVQEMIKDATCKGYLLPES